MRPPLDAIGAWRLSGPVQPVDGGLINRTFFVGPGPDHVLQWVNPIFPTSVQERIHALTEHLHGRGLRTPRLLPTVDGRLWLDDEEGFWRLMTYIPGTTHHRLESAGRAEAAGALLGRFHGALHGWTSPIAPPEPSIHDTPERMAELRRALDACDGHPLEGPARETGRAVLDAWDSWEGEEDLPERTCHGDPKISNLRFDETGKEGVCMVDLDTVGPQRLADEMGDAWRSWCNPAGEENADACRFDLDLFAASARGWRRHAGPVSSDELASLVPGIERISLELAARFCADAVQNTYFQENRERFPEPGSHNLQKARCQAALAGSARKERTRCERLLAGAQTSVEKAS